MTAHQPPSSLENLSASNAAPKPASGSSSPKRIRIIAAVVMLAAIATGGRMWWRSHNFEETDNAYLSAHVSVVSSRISGVVKNVPVSDNQIVRAGDMLVELDPSDQEVRVEQIKAQIAQIEAQIKQADAQLKQTDAEAQAAYALVTRAEVQWKRTEAEAQRYTSLYDVQVKSVSKTELDAAIAARDSAAAEVHSQQYQAKAANAKVTAIESSKVASLAQKKVLAAQLQDAELQLIYNKIAAPVNGRVGKKSVEVGTRVQAGQQLLAIVQDGTWVTANFKETQLHGLHAGQKARIRIDAFPGEELTGHVESFSPASGAQFSLLPPDNATGNFTKIVQRLPVKIILDMNEVKPIASRLAPGMSAIVEIDLRQGNPAARSAR